MKRLPKYLHKKIDSSIRQAQNMPDKYWNDWGIEVDHWGTPRNRIHYFGQSKEEALETIPATYSHTDTSGADLIVLQIKVHHLDRHKDIQDTEYIFELELTK